MRIAVMGAGGIGGNFGARLAAAGQDVALIARGAHLAAIRDHGINIISPTAGDIKVRPAMATDDASEIGPVDVVLFTTKHYDLESAGALCAPLLGSDTAVISLLNGVDAAERLAPIIGASHAVPGVTYTTAMVEAPGVVRHVSGPQLIGFGEPDGAKSARLDAFDAVARAAGIETDYSQAVQDLLWRKFVMLVAGGGVCALARQPVGYIRDDAELRGLYEKSAGEVIAVAAAKGIDMSAEKEKAVAFIDNAAPDLHPSLLVDLQKGNRLEAEWLVGAVVRMGRDLGIETPVNEVIWAALRPWANGR